MVEKKKNCAAWRKPIFFFQTYQHCSTLKRRRTTLEKYCKLKQMLFYRLHRNVVATNNQLTKRRRSANFSIFFF